MALSEEFNLRLFELVSGYLPSVEIGKLSELIQTEVVKHHFHRGCENNFLKILESSFNKAALVRDLIKFPQQLEVLVSVAANSNYLSDVLVRNPEFLYRIFDPTHLESRLERNFFRETVFASVLMQKSFDHKVRRIKSLKRQEILSTGVKDLIGYIDLKRATEELSNMSAVLGEALFLCCFEKVLKKYEIDNIGFPELAGIREVDQKDEELFSKLTGYAVVSLGKLGGGELNYSSDIDLIVIFNDNFRLPNGREYFELLNETIILFTESAVTVTDSGYLFRVDFRLRPDGHAAPLARTLRDTILYYETRGENWERQMLIKAGYFCGNPELYKRFIDSVTPFIYPASFYSSPKEQVARLRNTMLRTIGDDKNIKLFKGGIRDIEFGVQALQLLNGGRNKQLRTGNSLRAISELQLSKILTEKEAALLTDAYIFYRKIEHYLQLMNDRQTHIIPEEGDLLQSLTRYLGFYHVDAFNAKLTTYRKEVRSIYESIIGLDESDSKPAIDLSFFKDEAKAKKNLLFLKEGKGLIEIKEFDSRTTALYLEIEQKLLFLLSGRKFPDIALSNLAKVIQRSALPSYWYEAMKDEFLMDCVLNLCEYSDYAINLLTEDHSLKELIFSGKIFEKIDPESDYGLDTKAILFLAASQFFLGFIDEAEASQHISDTIRFKVEKLIKESSRGKSGFFVSIAGSFSLGEMHLFSDVDLIVVCDDMTSHPEMEEWFIKVLADIREELSPLTADCRLRPEGKSGQLVWDIKAYENYFRKRVQIWELQSLTKVSFLYGDNEVYSQFINLILEKVASLDKETLRQEVYEMRRKLYPASFSGLNNLPDLIKGRGGVTDIEFISQYLLLLDSIFLKLFMGNGNRKVLAAPQSSVTLDIEMMKNLLEGFEFLRKTRLAVEVMYRTSNNLLPAKAKGDKLFRFLGFDSYEELYYTVQTTLKKNNEIFQKLLKG